MLCYFCKNRLSQLVFLLVCAHCRSAWTPLEYEIAVIGEQRRQDRELLEATNGN